MEIYDGTLSDVFRMIISGSSGTGKSALINKILINENGLCETNFDNIVYLQGVETDSTLILKKKFKNKITILSSIPGEKELIKKCSQGKKNILIIEDLDIESFNSKLISSCFSKFSHHKKFSIIISTQNLFSQGPHRLTLIRNSTHIILFPNHLDHSVARLISNRINPSDPKKLISLYDFVTTENFGYLSIWGNCSHILRFRTDITCPAQTIYFLEEV